jgi:plasmid stabilization system protein ParE
MAAELVIAPDAELDIVEAYAWYEERRLGLGEEFLSSLDAGIQSVIRHPEKHLRAYGTYRRSLIRRFPYAIFYDETAHTVTIYGVFHTARHPDKWRQRLP